MFTVYWCTVVGCVVDITTPLSGQHFLSSGTYLVLNIFGLHPIKCSYIFAWMDNLKLIFIFATSMLVVVQHSENFRSKHVWICTHTCMFKFICLCISFLPSISMLTFTIVFLRLWCLLCNVSIVVRSTFILCFILCDPLATFLYVVSCMSGALALGAPEWL